MEEYSIYYSKIKTLISMIFMLAGLVIGVLLLINNSILWGVGFCIACILMLISYWSKFKKDQPIIVISEKGIQSEGEFIKWKMINSMKLKYESSEKRYLQLTIEYADKEALENYQTEKREIEKSNYHFDKEDFDKSQEMQKKADAELGFKGTYFEYFENEEEADKTFETNTEDNFNEDMKVEAEIDYTYKTIDFEDVSTSDKKITEILKYFENKTNLIIE